MRSRRSRGLLAVTIAGALAAAGLAGTAQANTTLPGGNGKIAFTSTRDFPFTVQSLGGSTSACVGLGPCTMELYSMDPNGGNQTRLTNNLIPDDSAAWLPSDGSRIAFQSSPADNGCSGCNYDIWSMPGGGGSAVQLTSDAGNEQNPTYSPDGSLLAYSGAFDESVAPTDSRLIPPADGRQIYIIPASGEGTSAPKPLLSPSQVGFPGGEGTTLDVSPTFSPDGTKIAFTRLEIGLDFGPAVAPGLAGLITDQRTYIAPVDGSAPATSLETYPACVLGGLPLSAAQDVLRSVRGATDWTSVQRTLHSRVAAQNCLADVKPAWSPDGTQIAVQRQTENTAVKSSTRLFGPVADMGDIEVIPVANPSAEVDLSDVSEPSNCDTGPSTPLCSADAWPAWSPDGTKIAFQSNRVSAADGSAAVNCIDDSTGEPNGACDNEIWTMNADGSGLTQLTDNAFQDTSPDWQRLPQVAPAAPVQPATPVKPKIGVAGVRTACVSKAFHVRFRVSTTASTVKKVVVKLDGRTIKSTSKGSFTLSIDSRKLKAGKHRLTIVATNAAGQTTTTHKSFSVCKAAKPRRRSAPRFTG